jgi:hypothetical protein
MMSMSRVGGVVAWVSVAVVAAGGCGDDIPSGGGDSTSGEETGGPTTSVSTSPTSGPGDADATAADDTRTTDATGDTGGGLMVDVQVHTYERQPMVVDLAFAAPDLVANVVDSTDPGVHSAPIAGDPGETWVRVRGLAPATLHELDFTVEDADGNTGAGQVDVQTEAPLSGFLPSFPAQGDSTGLGGYILFDLLAFSPTAPASLFLVDGDGTTRWHLGRDNATLDPSIVYAGAHLRPDGTILFLRDYTLSILDELGDDVLSIDSMALGVPGLHHDVVELDNGNFLTMSFTFRDINYPGPGVTRVAGDLLLEITPDAEIVWEWDSFDHLDPMRTLPGFEEVIVDPETGELAQDWTHSNGLLYEADTDSVLLSIRHQDWMIRIDRASGDIVWRFGDEGDFTLLGGTWPHHQHSPQWQDDGSLLVYDNGFHDPAVDDALETSRAVRYSIDEMAMTVTQEWEDEAEDFLVPIAGDADRLPDGTILITDSSIDFGIGMPYAQIRKVAERTPATPQWSFLTDVGTFVYRCVATDRLPGEAR